jgi:ribosome biogenesis protein YTM1
MTDLAITSDESIVLASSSDRVVALYDLRENLKSEPPTLLPHPTYPSSMCAHPTSPFKAVVGSYDGMVRLWDIRSAKAPVNAFKTLGKKNAGDELSQSEKSSGPKKILSVDWTTGLLAVGGEGGIDMWRVSESG